MTERGECSRCEFRLSYLIVATLICSDAEENLLMPDVKDLQKCLATLREESLSCTEYDARKGILACAVEMAADVRAEVRLSLMSSLNFIHKNRISGNSSNS